LVSPGRLSASGWPKLAPAGRPRPCRAPGHSAKVDPAQIRLSPDFLGRGAEAYGFRGAVWTCARVAKVIKEEFGISD